MTDIDESTLKKVPLHDDHVKCGAKMVPFSGYMMPVQYSLGILEEHKTVREKVGLFDISHMGELVIVGSDTENLLQKIMSNDLALMENGKAQYACMCYENGTVVDDCFYYRYSPTEYRVIINASNKDKDDAWIRKHAENFDVTIDNVSNNRGRLALQGPLAQETLQPLVDGFDLTELKRFRFKELKLGSVDCFVARTGYTGEDGFEISFDVKDSSQVWNLILDSGNQYEISPIGLGARDTLRLEASYSLYGNEISDKITPIEASIGFCVKPKEMDFIGKDVLLKQKTNGTTRKIVGIEVTGKGILRDHAVVYDESGDNEIGYVTSGTFSPTLQKSIGLAILKTEFTAIDTVVQVQIRKRKITSKVVKTPFYTYHGRK